MSYIWSLQCVLYHIFNNILQFQQAKHGYITSKSCLLIVSLWQMEKPLSAYFIPLHSEAKLLKHLLDKHQGIFITHCGTIGQALILPTCEAQDTPHAFVGRLSESLSSAWGNSGYIIKYCTANNSLYSVNIICLIPVTYCLDSPYEGVSSLEFGV